MDDYSRGFRDGAAAAVEAQADKFEDTINQVKDDPALPEFYSRHSVMELLRLLARQSETLAAQIAAVGNPRDEGDSNASDEGEAGSG